MSRREILRSLLALLALPATGATAGPPDQRLVSIGGGVTETIFALGEGGRLVGVDTTSTYPETARALPTVGYQHTLPLEGIAALRPSALLHDGSAGPERTLRRLERMGIDEIVLPGEPGFEGFRARTLSLGDLFGRRDEAQKIIDSVATELEAVRRKTPSEAPRAVFLMSHGEGATVAAGRATKADALLQLAGGRNVFSEFEGYRPVSVEALMQKHPDAVLTTGAAATDAALRGVPTLQGDTLFWLGFGPRLGQAVSEVATFLQRAVAHDTGHRSPIA
ncbi:hemin ABC transporter substrate-binding protein [Thioalkalivibrio sp. ALJT]|uniref:heme/hemin ABC transporter substrate-binding protein n=1 Tax=Thioalkalivibrio sp. ALJT TaxID=1158146 RepID=UPI00035CBF83|nr:ABC transporter substrate-binding protein [Thioalkalivibrio sp. ALJT]